MKLPRGTARDILFAALGTASFGVLYTPVGDLLSEPLRKVAYRGASWLLGVIGEAHRAAPAKYLLSSLSSPPASITITPSCSGLRAVALWAIFVAFAPIPFQKRLLHFAAGASLLLTINVARLAHLFSLRAHHPTDFELYHEWIWPLAKVAVIAVYWTVLVLLSLRKKGLPPTASVASRWAPVRVRGAQP